MEHHKLSCILGYTLVMLLEVVGFKHLKSVLRLVTLYSLFGNPLASTVIACVGPLSDMIFCDTLFLGHLKDDFLSHL